MDQRDEFSKWMGAIEEALANENAGALDINMLPQEQNGTCGCGNWQCTVCFPEQGESPAAQACPTCGHVVDGHEHAPVDSIGAVEVGPEEFDTIVPMEEEDNDFDVTPRSGKGVKLGDIVQKFVPADQAGEVSPLTHGGDNLDEEGWYDPSMDDVEFGGPQDRDNEIISDEQMDQAMDMIGQIKYMQDMGLSKADRAYSEEEMANMNFSTLKQCYDTVTGSVSEEMPQDLDMGSMGTGPSQGGGASGGATYAPGTAPTMPESIQQGQTTMENVDKDIGTWLERFKAYDELRASKMPVTETKQEVSEAEDKNPWEKLASDKKDDEEGAETKTHKGGTVTKTKTGIVHKKADESVEVSEAVDPEVLEWMNRFAKLGNMKGYGR